VSYMDSTGIGELVSAFKMAANAGCQVKLVNLTKRVKDLLPMRKFADIFEFASEDAAIESFKNE
jgi:anti-sigma B factor antagonist